MNLPAKVRAELLKRHDLHDEIAELIELLMVREVTNGYPAIRYYRPEKVDDLLIPYVTAFHFILSRIKQTRGHNPFKIPIWQLAGLKHEHFYALSQLGEYQFREIAHSDMPPEVRRFDGDFSRRYGHGIWYDFLAYLLVVDIPAHIRFEHTHILGQTGSGKTELIKALIAQDVQSNAGIIVMAPKGNLIPDIARLGTIDPDRLVLVRPDDFDHPIALNIFDMQGDTNNVVGLINYIFSSILDSATTSKQTALLNYCIRLLLKVPKATLITLRALMREETLPDDYQQYVATLSDSAQEFFRFQFGNKKLYGETKEQMLWRLDLLLENTIVEKIFSQPKTLLKMNDVMAGGKVLLIDTSIKTLGDMGSSFLGRFFIALVSLASQQRDTTKPLRAAYFYIDEASVYIDEKIEGLLERARESKVGVTLAHQQLTQLSKISQNLQGSVTTNTSIKIVGSCSHGDARAMANEMGVEPEKIQHQAPLHFLIKAKGWLTTPISTRVEPGHLKNLARRDETEMQNIVEQNRARYCTSFTPNPTPPFTPPSVAQPRNIPDDDIESLNKA